MSPEFSRTLFIYAAILAVLVVLALGLAPGVELVSLGVLLVLILGGISFLFSEVRARRRHRRRVAHRQALAGGQAARRRPRFAKRRPRFAKSRPRFAKGWPRFAKGWRSARTRVRAPGGPAVMGARRSRRARARRRSLL